MRARTHHSTARTSTYGEFDADEPYAHSELIAGERVGPPLSRTGRKAMLRGLLLLILLGGGWALLGDQATWSGWLQTVTAAVSSAMERMAPGPVGPTAKPAPFDPLPPIPQAPAPSRTAPPADAAATPAPPVTTAAVTPAAAEQPGLPLPPPIIDPTDPHQARAVAVGLHPELSRVLLARLSPDDYRNAGIAIQRAVAETPDNGVFVWPRQRKPELALFQVRFVAGAAPDCRRYVVSITKDGWLTTALPMERCGPQPGRPRRE